MSRITFSLVAAGLLAVTASALPFSNQPKGCSTNVTGMVHSFEDVPHSANLQWTPCYDDYYCANLEVPLDYTNSTVGTVIVAFIRQQAANSTGQDILFNPGGPGGSGIDFILSGGGNGIIDASGGKYNLVSFDPRGVNNSGIALTCFPGDTAARDAFYGSLGAPLSLYERYYEVYSAGRYCTEATKDSLVKYAGTTAVVQDLIYFTELQAALNGNKKPKEAKIWYYGVSYGTVIGQTLAALYPDRIGRIIVDANVNAEDHYNGLAATAVADTDAGFEWFFKLCYDAGPKKCAFFGNATSSADVKKRFDSLLAKLEKAPVMATTKPGIITKSSVISQFFSVLYAPFSKFTYLAIGLDALDKNNATIWYNMQSALTDKSDPGPFNYDSTASQEVLSLVTAVDAAGRYPIKNADDYIKVVGQLEKLSTYAGRSYAETNVLINAGLKIIPPKSQFFPGFKKTKTSTPIFFINTSADPVTPVSSAKHMSQYFEGSIVLVQNSVGHAYSSVPSSCTLGYVKAYWESGKLPKNGTVCETDTKPLVNGESIARRAVPVPKRHLEWK